MKSTIVMTVLALSASVVAVPAFAKTSCEDVIARIESKLKGKGVKAFTLTSVPKDEKTELRVVGTCDGGTKKIVYKRG